MFERTDSTEPKSFSLLWAGLKSIVFGVASFFPAFLVSLLITIPWSKHYWAGDGQAVLGGLGVSFFFGIASTFVVALYTLRRTTQWHRLRIVLIAVGVVVMAYVLLILFVPDSMIAGFHFR